MPVGVPPVRPDSHFLETSMYRTPLAVAARLMLGVGTLLAGSLSLSAQTAPPTAQQIAAAILPLPETMLLFLLLFVRLS